MNKEKLFTLLAAILVFTPFIVAYGSYFLWKANNQVETYTGEVFIYREIDNGIKILFRGNPDAWIIREDSPAFPDIETMREGETWTFKYMRKNPNRLNAGKLVYEVKQIV